MTLTGLFGRARELTPKDGQVAFTVSESLVYLRTPGPVQRITAGAVTHDLWVWGNGNGGRVIFELEDAKGERWISIGAEQGGEPNPWMADFMPPAVFEALRARGKAGISDWNSDDAWGRSVFNHDGWRYVRFPLPGHYGRNRDIYHWPSNSQWRFTGEGRVDYPLRFTRLVITLPEKILYGTDWREADARTVRLSALQTHE